MRVAMRTPIAGKLGDEIERVFDRFLAPRWLPEPFLPEFPFETTATEWIPVLEVVENANEFVVRLEVPGIPRENLDLNLTGQMLAITGKREMKPETTAETYLVRERLYGKFVRTVRLPVPVAADKVTATFEEGMLVVHLPKAVPAPANKILIR
jgi:HSP20 family protein